jgi:hypothetical protein
LTLLCLAAGLAGCGGLPRAPGKVHEQGLIAPDQKIAILWTVGPFTDSTASQILQRDGTLGKRYEGCTNALIEQTFRANGYTAWASKLEPGQRAAVPADARYVLSLRNVSVRYSRTPSGSAVLLDVEGDLFDRKSGKRLWTVYNWLSSDAARNSITSVHLVRALAADGYIGLKPEEVADYRGGRAKSDDEITTACP